MSYRLRFPMDEPAVYRIVVLGQVDARLAAWLGDMQLRETQNLQGRNVCTLSGLLRDQAALIGLLVQLYNRGYCLLELERETGEPPPQS